MLKKLSFDKKLFLMLAVFFLAAVLLGTAGFYIYVYNTNREKNETTFLQINKAVISELDGLLKKMDDFSGRLVISEGMQKIFVEAKYSSSSSSMYFDYHLEDKRAVIKEFISLAETDMNNYVVNVYQKPNIFISNSIKKENSEYIRAHLMRSPNSAVWDDLERKYQVREPRADEWHSAGSQDIYFSLIRPFRAIYYGNQDAGTIEVLEDYQDIQDICTSSDLAEEEEIVIIDSKTRELIYPLHSIGRESLDFYQDYLQMESGSLLETTVPDGTKMMMNIWRSEKSDWVMFAVQPMRVFMKPMDNMTILTVVIFVLFAGISCYCLYYVTSRLTKPIRQLRAAVEEVTIDNVSLVLDTSDNNEIILLQKVFVDILAKLQESAIKLSLSRTTEYDAKISALQAQINPHFLYNSLMAISAAGMENHNRKVVAMCTQLSTLFRYTALEKPRVSIGEEIAYIRTYLKFMQWRYLDTLEYVIEECEEIARVEVPRLILQPIVENCFVYAFQSILPPMRLHIRCSQAEGRWYVEVTDNGCGISQEELSKITCLMEGVANAFRMKKHGDRLETDGKALVNIYARLYLSYGEDTIFRFENTQSGFKVVIGGLMVTVDPTIL